VFTTGTGPETNTMPPSATRWCACAMPLSRWASTVANAFASYRAAIIRLDGLLTANERSRALTRLAARDPCRWPDGVGRRGRTVAIRGRTRRRLGGSARGGDSLVITGRSGSGKTTLLRSLAQMWPHASGSVRYPSEDGAMFLPQLPHAPLGEIRTVTCYPNFRDTFGDNEIRGALGVATSVA
jgi:vitamin B12/bleomycin/antimicrobial peptide transport system ATP-binding/permease protein